MRRVFYPLLSACARWRRRPVRRLCGPMRTINMANLLLGDGYILYPDMKSVCRLLV